MLLLFPPYPSNLPSLCLSRPDSHGLVYGGKSAVVGPTLSGCSHNATAATITVRFNASLLTKAGRVIVKPYDRATVNSAMRVLVEAKRWCHRTVLTPKIGARWGAQMCVDDGAPNYGACGGATQCATSAAVSVGGRRRAAAISAVPTAAPTTMLTAHSRRAARGAAGAPETDAWVLVDIISASATSITLDLARLNGKKPLALRYAWGNTRDACCPPGLNATQVCVPGSCPLFDLTSNLPATPFTARITRGKCRCIAPQRCDE